MTRFLLKTFFTFTIIFSLFSHQVEARKYVKVPSDSHELYIFHYDVLVENKLVVKYYPNPARDFINFEFDKHIENNSRLIIFSFTGKKMTEIQISNLKITVNLGDYFRGLYLFQLVSPKGQVLESGKFQVLK